jgi:hypothetical protein
MTELLEKAIEALRELPPERQDAIGEMLLALAQPREYSLTPEQIEGIREAQESVARGEFASDDEIRRIFGRTFD